MGRNQQETLETLTRNLEESCESRHAARAWGEPVAAKSDQDGHRYRAQVVPLEENDVLGVKPQQAVHARVAATNSARNQLGTSPPGMQGAERPSSAVCAGGTKLPRLRASPQGSSMFCFFQKDSKMWASAPQVSTRKVNKNA